MPQIPNSRAGSDNRYENANFKNKILKLDNVEDNSSNLSQRSEDNEEIQDLLTDIKEDLKISYEERPEESLKIIFKNQRFNNQNYSAGMMDYHNQESFYSQQNQNIQCQNSRMMNNQPEKPVFMGFNNNAQNEMNNYKQDYQNMYEIRNQDSVSQDPSQFLMHANAMMPQFQNIMENINMQNFNENIPMNIPMPPPFPYGNPYPAPPNLMGLNNYYFPPLGPEGYGLPMMCPPNMDLQNQNTMYANNPYFFMDPMLRGSRKKLHPFKKPLNAFMLYMKDIRPEIVKTQNLRDSVEINKIIGKMWQSLTQEEKDVYFKKANIEKENQKQLQRLATNNFNHRMMPRKKRKKREKVNPEEPILKKCRARFGVEQIDQWCKPCKRKKKCIKFKSDSCSNGDDCEGKENNTYEEEKAKQNVSDEIVQNVVQCETSANRDVSEYINKREDENYNNILMNLGDIPFSSFSEFNFNTCQDYLKEENNFKVIMDPEKSNMDETDYKK